MQRNLIMRSWSVAFLAYAALSAASVAAKQFVVDQASEGNPFGFYGIDVQTGDTIGQEFTPTASALDVVEIGLGPHTRDSLGVKVNIRAGALDGPIVGTSLLATTPSVPLPAPSYHFDFPAPVPLVPGNLYVIQPFLVQPTAPVAFAFLDPPPYAGGRPFIHTQFRDDIDMVFRTGLTVPEPGTATLLLFSAMTLPATARRRKVPANCAASTKTMPAGSGTTAREGEAPAEPPPAVRPKLARHVA
jgi:hypothetical protein